MTTFAIISLFWLTIISTAFIFLLIKHIKLKNSVKKIYEDIKRRKGYFKYNMRNLSTYENFEVIVYITELEHYKNNLSKFKITDVEYSNIADKSAVLDWLQTKSPSIKDCKDITWLDIEEDIKETRRKKLQQILKINA